MREEYWHHLFWLLVAGSWALGVAHGKWGGGYGGFFSELGQIISVPLPSQLELWQPIVYFTLTVVAAFVLSQLFFGLGAAVFLFARGVADSGLVTSLEVMMGSWNLLSIPPAEIWSVFYVLLALAVNLPLCLWAAHLGTQRALRMFYRIRGRPLRPSGGEPISELVMLVSVSVVVGLVATFAAAYA